MGEWKRVNNSPWGLRPSTCLPSASESAPIRGQSGFSHSATPSVLPSVWPLYPSECAMHPSIHQSTPPGTQPRRPCLRAQTGMSDEGVCGPTGAHFRRSTPPPVISIVAPGTRRNNGIMPGNQAFNRGAGVSQGRGASDSNLSESNLERVQKDRRNPR